MWLTILLALLGQLLSWLLSLINDGKQMTESQMQKVNFILYRFRQIEPNAVQLGAKPGGELPPPEWNDESFWGP